MAKVDLMYKDSYITVNIPETNLIDVLENRDLPGVDNPTYEVKKALDNPIGIPMLRDIVRGKKI